MSALKNNRHRFEYVAFLAIASVMRALPLEMASRWSGGAWRLFAPRLQRHQRALLNLALAYPEKTPVEIEQIALGMWDNLGRTFAEFFQIDRILGSDRIELESPDLFEVVRGRGRGGVVCGLHMGNWEILSQAAARIGWRPAGVYQKITNPFVDRYVSAVRAPLYPGGLMEKSPQAARSLLRYARNGGCAAFLADQRESRGIAAPFFGRPAHSTTFPAMIARAVNAPLYACGVKRLIGARFSVHLAEVPVPRTADRDADVATATKDLQSAFELMIRDAPDQWMWGHRRWD